MTRVLFPDPFIITLNTAVRALAGRGDVCHVAWPYGWTKRLFKSRYVSEVIRTPDRNADAEAFADRIVDLCRGGNYDVILPVTTEATEALISRREDLDRLVTTLLPTAAQLALGTDKVETWQLCEELGIAHPRTWSVADTADLDRVIAAAGYPVIVKHPRNLGGSRGVRFAGDRDELQLAFEQLRALSDTPTALIIQEFIPGFLFDAVTVARNGECPTVFTSARKLMYPVSGGVTCVSVSTRTPELKAMARRIVQATGWNGPVEIEFKLDPRDNRFKLIEINPRFWASLATSVVCGVNFPAIAVDLALGRPVPASDEHDYGVRHKYMIGRVPYAYWQLARAHGLDAIRDPQIYVRSCLDLDAADPMPDLFRLLLFCRDLMKGRFPRRLNRGASRMIHGLQNPVLYD